MRAPSRSAVLPGEAADLESAGVSAAGEEERRDAEAVVPGPFERVGDTVCPRNATPCRCTTRYRVDSLKLKRARIAAVEVFESAYSRAIARSSS